MPYAISNKNSTSLRLKLLPGMVSICMSVSRFAMTSRYSSRLSWRYFRFFLLRFIGLLQTVHRLVTKLEWEMCNGQPCTVFIPCTELARGLMQYYELSIESQAWQTKRNSEIESSQPKPFLPFIPFPVTFPLERLLFFDSQRLAPPKTGNGLVVDPSLHSSVSG